MPCALLDNTCNLDLTGDTDFNNFKEKIVKQSTTVFQLQIKH